MAYKLISTKGTREVEGTLEDAIAMEADLQPAYGVTVDLDGETVAEIRDGVDASDDKVPTTDAERDSSEAMLEATNLLTAYESCRLVLGTWADKLWPLLRDRPALLEEMAELAPLWRPVLDSEGYESMVDVHAGHRAAWISDRCREHDVSTGAP